jgi:glycosyltransferase involved in cell wall biosynthesis
VLARADAVVVPSPYLAAPLAAYGAPAPRVVSNIIDTGAYPHRLRKAVAPRLFWMRSFHSLYNPLMAVRVLSRVREGHPGATLVMAGQDKGMIPDVLAEADRLGVRGAVRIAGFLDHAAKVREADAADIFINTNRVDNMPVAVVEAGAMGLPVVATAVGGLPMLLEDGTTGLLVADDDDAGMARAVLRLVDEPGLAERLSAAGRSLAEAARWERVGPQWGSVLDSVARPRTRRVR